MIRWSSLLFIIFIVIGAELRSQDLYDLDHSKEFARYLFSSKQFDEAAREYERVVFLDSSDFESRCLLIQSYRFSGQYGTVIKRLENYSSLKPLNLQNPLSKEYSLTLLLSERYNEGRGYITGTANLDRAEKSELYLGSFLLQADWNNAVWFSDTAFRSTSALYSDLLSISVAGTQLRHRSPALAMSMSAIVPGLGKAYAGEWKDGVVSLLFVVSNAFQSYRGFRSDGISSPYGWVFGTLALGFYSGNLYGTYKSAQRFNTKQNAPLQHRTSHLLFDIP